MPQNSAPQVIAGVSDLIFTSKISETARHIGVSVGFAGNQQVLLGKTDPAPVLIILDLNLKALDPLSLIRKLKQDPRTAHIPVTAYANHECSDLIEGAKQAGCDAVLTRGAFSSGLPQLLARHLTTQPSQRGH
jgi:CheY-like chemotaxis protein